jgi:signal peptidase
MFWRYTKRTFTAAVLLLIVGASVLSVTTKINGGKLLSVQTHSMVPTLQKGTLVSVSRVPVRNLNVGDIITFINPLNKRTTITHRIVQTPGAGNGYKFVTKGDANKVSDSPISSASIVGREQFAVPYAGYFADFIRQPAGLILIIYIPALAIVMQELRRLAAYYRSQQPYIAAGYIPHRDPAGKHRLATLVSVSAALVLLSGLVALPVQAALQSTARLTGNTIQTGPLSQPHQCLGNNHTSITVTNSSNQSSNTGNSTNSGNTSSGSASSGSASNSNSTTINANVKNC